MCKIYWETVSHIVKTIAILLGLMLTAVQISNAQELALGEGFRLIESNNYTEAILFFENKNKVFPDNKYVLQALTRSYGLNQNFDKAFELCDGFLLSHPMDTDLIGTKAELYLWKKEYGSAVELLQPLYSETTSIGSTDIIYCNALIAGGNLQAARKIMPYIQRHEASLVWMDLYKNLYLKLAAAARQEEDYGSAISLLDSILLLKPSDPNTLMTKGDVYMEQAQYSRAATAYQDMVATGKDKTNAMINYSYALFKAKHPILSLSVAQQAWIENQNNIYTTINYFNAMLWNGKLQEARIFLDKNKSMLGEDHTLLLEARWEVASGRFQKGVLLYKKLNEKVADKNYLMEYMILLLNKNYTSELHSLLFLKEKMLNEKDKAEIQNQLALKLPSKIGLQGDYFIDIADNEYVSKSIYWSDWISNTLKTQITAGNIQYKHSISKDISSYFGKLNVNYVINPIWKMEADAAIYSFKPLGSKSFRMDAEKISIVHQANDRYMFRFGGTKDFMNFTNELLLKKVKLYRASFATNLMFSSKVGLYVESDYTQYSDSNRRGLIFGSLYEVVRTEPTLKLGVNSTLLHFTIPNNPFYFAPRKYYNSEIFLDYTTAFAQKSKFYTNVQLAIGMQGIENKKADMTYRLQCEAGMHLRHVDVYAKYQAGNASNATNTGYSYDLATFNVCYKW